MYARLCVIWPYGSNGKGVGRLSGSCQLARNLWALLKLINDNGIQLHVLSEMRIITSAEYVIWVWS